MDRKEIDTMRQGRLYILILSVFLCHFTVGHAEHLLEVGVHGGAAGWNAQPVYVQSKIGFNGGAQLYYNYLSPYVVGFRTGLTVDCHNAGFAKTNFEDAYTTLDVDNEIMEIDYTINQFNERYTSWSVGIPLQLALAKSNFMCLLGAKAVFPLSTTWKQTVDHAALSIYYPEYDNRIYESYLAASRDFSVTNEGKMQFPKIQWWLATELSYKIPLNSNARKRRSYIIIGAYFDYCFTKHTPAITNAESLMMLTDTRDGFPLQRVLTPVLEADRQGRKLVNGCSFFDVGVKVSYAFSVSKPSRCESYPCRCIDVW